MGYSMEMELALKEMDVHPEFSEKIFIDMEEETNDWDYVFHQSSTQRPNGWQRKREYKKKLFRRFLSLNPSLNIADVLGSRQGRGPHYVRFEEPFDPRSKYTLNLYERLYLSPAGDIRVCKRRIIHHGGCKAYRLRQSDLPFAKQYTSRRIRSKVIPDDARAPSGRAYYRKQNSMLIDNSID